MGNRPSAADPGQFVDEDETPATSPKSPRVSPAELDAAGIVPFLPKKLRDPPNDASIRKNLKDALEQYKENADANWEFKDTERMFRASEERTNKKLANMEKKIDALVQHKDAEPGPVSGSEECTKKELAETQKQLAELAETQRKILNMLQSPLEK